MEMQMKDFIHRLIPKPLRPIALNFVGFLRNPRYFIWYAKRMHGLTDAKIRYLLEHQFKATMGYPPNLDNPRTLNEKIQWLKLNYRNPLLTKCADKVRVRDYIRDTIGEKYLVPIVGVYDSPDEIPFQNLPDKFVMKVNWGSGQNIICKNKNSLDVADVKRKLDRWMQPISNHYYNFFEWCYKDIPPKILVEEYMEDLDGDLPDFKFFCYNGRVENMFIAKGRNLGDHTLSFTFFDRDFNRLPLKQHYPTFDGKIEKPDNWDEMITLAEKLAKPFLFARIDFYIVGNSIKFGEITFNHFSGAVPFNPPEWDKKFGALINLSPEQSIS